MKTDRIGNGTLSRSGLPPLSRRGETEAAEVYWNLLPENCHYPDSLRLMNPIQVVIDTNVLVAAWRSRNGASFRLISSFIAGEDRWQWNVSTAVLLEYEELLIRQGFDSSLVARFLDDLANRANRIKIYFLSRPALLDSDDEFVLDLAVASGSDVIVTYNTSNFLAARAFGIRILAPKDFLAILGKKP